MSKILFYFFDVLKQNFFCFIGLFIYLVFKFKNLEAWYSHLIFSIVMFSLVLSLVKDGNGSYNLLRVFKKMIIFFVIMLILTNLTSWSALHIDIFFNTFRGHLNDLPSPSRISSDYDTFLYILSSVTAKSFLFALCASVIYMATILQISKFKFFSMIFKPFLINFTILFAVNSAFLILWHISYSRKMYDLLLYSGALNEVVSIFIVLAIGRIAYEKYS